MIFYSDCDTFHSGVVFLIVFPWSLQILVLELNDEAAEQTVEAKVVDLLQGQEGFRWKVPRAALVTVEMITHHSLKAVISHRTVTFVVDLP